MCVSKVCPLMLNVVQMVCEYQWNIGDKCPTHQVIDLIGQLDLLICILQGFVIILKHREFTMSVIVALALFFNWHYYYIADHSLTLLIIC